MSLFHRLLLLATLLTLSLTAAKAGAIVDAETDDNPVMQTQVANGEYDHIYDASVGALYGTDSNCLVDGFALPYMGPGQTITGATISYYLESQNGSPTYNVQLYGLKRVSTTSSATIQSDWYTGSNDSSNTLLDAKFVTPSTTTGQTVSYSGANLASFLQTQSSNAAFSNDLSTTCFVFFRLSPDGTQGGFNNYEFSTSRNPQRAQHPNLALTISGGISNIAGRLQFSFNLPTAATTSAGVYDAGTGKLLRTIWNNIRYGAGTNYGVWDGKDDNGNTLAAGTNYQIKLIYHNVQYIWGGMVGNTSASQSGQHVYHAFGKIHDMAFGGSNTGYYTVAYNELEACFYQFTVGAPQVPSEVNMGYEFNDPFSSIYYVATDGTRTYWAKTFGGMSGANTYVIAITNGGSGTSTFYTFPKGTTPGGSNQKYTSCVDYDSTANQPNSASGLAVQKSGNLLFVAHANLNVVRVFDKVQGNLLGTISVPAPGRLAVTANGDVWVCSNDSTPSVNRYTFSNGSATLQQTITGLQNPVGVGVSADDSLVLVTDAGTSQQVKAFNNNTGAAAWTYGVAGGMAVNGPNVTNNVFQFSAQVSNFNNFSTESFIAFQADNTFWVDDCGNGRILHFGISGNTPVFIEQIAYIDVSYRATCDPTDATRTFNGFMEHDVDYSKPLGGTNGSWKLVKNWFYGLPNDSTHLYAGFAQGFNNVCTLSNGRTYGLIQNMITNNWDLFELPSSGPLRFTGYSYNNDPRMYEDGTMRYNITAPNNGSLAFYSAPLTGFDTANNPVWGSPELLANVPLTSTDPFPWVAFTLRTEMTSSGMVIDFDANQHDNLVFHLAGVPRGGTAFKWRSSPSTSLNGTRTGWFPQDGEFDCRSGVQYGGNIAMAMGRNIVYGYHGEFWSGGQASQWVNFLDNGLMVGLFGTFESPAEIASNTINGYAGNSFSPSMVRAPDGNTYIYFNDESDHAGTCQWKITGWDGINEISGTGTIGSTAALSDNGQGPVVSITSPTNGANYLNGNNVLISASVAGTGSPIASVEFFDGSTSLGLVSSAPYSLSTTAMGAGSHSLTAKATDQNGVTTVSNAVAFTIASSAGGTPPAPSSLAVGATTSQSVALNWTPASGSSSGSTIGEIISFQCIPKGDANALSSSASAGASAYSVTNWNIMGQSPTNGITFPTIMNSLGNVVSNLGLNLTVTGSNDTNSNQALTGTDAKLFNAEISTTYNTAIAISVSNIPYAQYDVVVYSQPPNISTGAKTSTVTVGDGAYVLGKVTQNFTVLPTGITTGSVAYGASTTMTNVNAVVFSGLTTPLVEIQGSNIAGFQIVQRPYNQGSVGSYTIERAGSDGNFAAIGTATASASSYTDSTVAAGTVYSYRIKASNSAGDSAYSNVVTVTVPGTVAGSGTGSGTGTGTGTGTGGSVASFTSWQSKYFSAAQLADPTVSGPAADPYGSGVPNLLAYALQLDPSTAKPTDVPNPTVLNGHLAVTYFVPAAVTDITYIVEVSSNLTAWNSGAGYTTVVSNVSNSAGSTVTIQDTLPTTTEKHFMRLRVTQN